MEFQKLFTLFRTATKELKYPTMRFIAETGEKVSLFYAFKGYIGIKINNVYVGKITPEPEMKFRMYEGASTLQNEIREFCKNPLPNAVIKGQRYNNCCFCGLELTNKASVQSGYGPICAGKWGLPWEFKNEPLVSLDPDATVPMGTTVNKATPGTINLVNRVTALPGTNNDLREEQIEKVAEEIANSDLVPTPLIAHAVFHFQLSPTEAFNLACSVAEYLADMKG